MIRILLAEGHNIVRNGIRSLLEKETDIQVVAEVNNGREALRLLAEGTQADIIITAITMVEMGGIDLITRINETYPHIKVIVLSRLSDEKSILDAFKAGALGYILKSVKPDELLFGIRHVYSSAERFLCNEVALNLLDRLITLSSTIFDVDVANLEISKREIEVLIQIAQGFTNQEIADKLFTSKRTIESHRQNLIAKTGTRNTAALVRYAVLNSIIK